MLPEGAYWISNTGRRTASASSRSASELPDLGGFRELIGDEPVVAEEFDVE